MQLADTPTTARVALLCAGAGIVAAAHLVGRASGEPDEMVLAAPGPLARRPRRTVAPTPPAPPLG